MGDKKSKKKDDKKGKKGKKKDKKKKKKTKQDEDSLAPNKLSEDPSPDRVDRVSNPVDIEKMEQKPKEASSNDPPEQKKLTKKIYNKELRRLQVELVKLQEWVKVQKLKVVVIFEGRDAAGKGGVIKRITQCLNPRTARVVALGVPTEREKRSGIFNATSLTCPRLERSCSLTAAGTTGLAWNASWDSAPMKIIRNLCAAALSLNACWCVQGSS